MPVRSLAAAVVALLLIGLGRAEADPTADALAGDIFKQLIEINTTESVGSVTAASEAMAERLSAAGFSGGDLQVLGPNDRKKNLVVR
ncbi:MAG: hypothetical protein JO042_12550, partial [Sinobacteraceae bacterium]|nr:hypothetical protein [Nevskiaceae bacterium]